MLGLRFKVMIGVRGLGRLRRGLQGVMDFSLMQDVGKRYDWVQSLEAAEQIPQGKIVVYM
jgi:hypothetical protein